MKKLISMKSKLMYSLVIALSLLSCKGNINDSNKGNLIGKVFQSSLGMDSDCKTIEKGTDYYQNIVFINDSIFLKVAYTCCPDEEDTSDFAAEFVYKGLYKIADSILTLKYNSKVAILYDKSNISSDSLSTSKSYVKVHAINETYTRLFLNRCNNIPYLKQNDDEFSNEFLTPLENSYETFKTNLEKNGIWKLIEGKQLEN
jgi:hypothetical protein